MASQSSTYGTSTAWFWIELVLSMRELIFFCNDRMASDSRAVVYAIRFGHARLTTLNQRMCT